MKTRSRAALLSAGSAALYLLLMAPYLRQVWRGPANLPPLELNRKFLYACWTHAFVQQLGPYASSVLIANMLLLMASALVLLRVTLLCQGLDRRLMVGTLVVPLFLLNPAVVAQVSFSGPGETPLAVLGVLFYVWMLLATKNWSIFMRAQVAAAAWLVVLWCDVWAAFALAVGVLPWMAFTRRRWDSAAIWLTMIFCGGFAFAMTWMGLAWARHEIAGASWAGLSRAFVLGDWPAGMRSLLGRAVLLSIWLSPFLLVWCVWRVAHRFRGMAAEYRAGLPDLVAVWAAVFALLCLGWPVAYPVTCLLLLLVPLIIEWPKLPSEKARQAFQWTAAIGFFVGTLLFGLQLRLPFRHIQAVGAVFVWGTLAVLAAGFVSARVAPGTGLEWRTRAHALLASVTLAYYLVFDLMVFRS